MEYSDTLTARDNCRLDPISFFKELANSCDTDLIKSVGASSSNYRDSIS